MHVYSRPPTSHGINLSDRSSIPNSCTIEPGSGQLRLPVSSLLRTESICFWPRLITISELLSRVYMIVSINKFLFHFWSSSCDFLVILCLSTATLARRLLTGIPNPPSQLIRFARIFIRGEDRCFWLPRLVRRLLAVTARTTSLTANRV